LYSERAHLVKGVGFLVHQWVSSLLSPQRPPLVGLALMMPANLLMFFLIFPQMFF